MPILIARLAIDSNFYYIHRRLVRGRGADDDYKDTEKKTMI